LRCGVRKGEIRGGALLTARLTLRGRYSTAQPRSLRKTWIVPAAADHDYMESVLGCQGYRYQFNFHQTPLSNGIEYTCCRSSPFAEKKACSQKKKDITAFVRMNDDELARSGSTTVLSIAGSKMPRLPARSTGLSGRTHRSKTIAQYDSRAVSLVFQWCELVQIPGYEACLGGWK
jgi:hypothetical protein